MDGPRYGLRGNSMRSDAAVSFAIRMQLAALAEGRALANSRCAETMTTTTGWSRGCAYAYCVLRRRAHEIWELKPGLHQQAAN